MRETLKNAGGARSFVCAGLILVLAAILTAGAANARSSGDRTLLVVNENDMPLAYLYASNVDEIYWGSDDRLGEIVLRNGETVLINLDDGTGHCLFDLRAQFVDGRVEEIRSVDVCAEEEVTFY